MEYPEVILIKMPWRGPCDENLIPPLGLGSLSQVLRDAEVPHRVFDLAAAAGKAAEVFELLKSPSLRFAAVSFGSAGYLKSYEFINKIHAARKDVRIIVGGWHPSSIGMQIFDECPVVDFSVSGPGETAFRDIVLNGNSRRSNVMTKNGRGDGGYGDIELRKCVEPSWQFPRYKDMDLSPYKLQGVMGILTSRGCPSRCTFCSSTRVSGLGYLGREVDDIAAEFEYHLERGVSTFQILDDNMTLRADRAMAVFDRIRQMRSRWPELRITMPNGIRADRCTPELLTAAAECGVDVLLFGVESANNDMLKAMKKGETVEQIRSAVSNAFDAGLQVRLAFLIGMPGERPEHVENSMNFVESFYNQGRVFNDIYINHPIPFPGTELYEQLTESGSLRITPEEYLHCPAGRYFGIEPIYSTPEMSLSQRKQLFKRFQLLRRRVCPGLPPEPVGKLTEFMNRARPDRLARRAGRKIIRAAQKLVRSAS